MFSLMEVWHQLNPYLCCSGLWYSIVSSWGYQCNVAIFVCICWCCRTAKATELWAIGLNIAAAAVTVVETNDMYRITVGHC